MRLLNKMLPDPQRKLMLDQPIPDWWGIAALVMIVVFCLAFGLLVIWAVRWVMTP